MILFRTASVFLILCLSLAGCSRIPGGVAPSNVPLEPGTYTIVGPVSATDCKVDLLGLIPISGGNYTHQAIEKARKNGNADALIGISVDRSSKYFILWSQVCTEVYATAVNYR